MTKLDDFQYLVIFGKKSEKKEKETPDSITKSTLTFTTKSKLNHCEINLPSKLTVKILYIRTKHPHLLTRTYK